jgi:hypothetical protein
MTRVATSAALAALTALHATFGIAMPERCHDAARIRATWCGNDRIALRAVAPAPAAGAVLLCRGSRLPAAP